VSLEIQPNIKNYFHIKQVLITGKYCPDGSIVWFITGGKIVTSLFTANDISEPGETAKKA